MGPTVTISLLGGFMVAIADRSVDGPAFGHRPAASVVKMLALAPGHRLPSEVIADRLWPELSADRGRANLRKAVHFARRALGERAVDVRDDGVALLPGADLVVDAMRFEAAAQTALQARDPVAATSAARLYTGDLLPDDRYATWTDAQRERLRDLALTVLKLAVDWERVLQIDPLDEEAHRGRMLDQLEAGNRQAAIQQFERLRATLRDELGIAPDPRTVEVYERALATERPEAPTPAQRARALLAWGMVHWERHDLDEAERTAREARALAVDAGLGSELGEASAMIGMIAQARGEWREFFRDELVGSVRDIPQLAPFVFDANVCLSEYCLYLPGALPEMAAFADELERTAEQSGSLQGHALANLVRGEVELLSGHLAASEVALAEAAATHPATAAGSTTPLAMARLAEARLWAGQRWKAQRGLGRALRLAEASPMAAHLVVRVYGAMVESAASATLAAGVVTEAETALAGVQVCQSCSIGYRVAAARRLAEAGDLDAASAHLEAAGRIATMWPSGPWAGEVLEARALIARAEGRPQDAPDLLGEAAGLYADAGFALHAARCRSALEAA